MFVQMYSGTTASVATAWGTAASSCSQKFAALLVDTRALVSLFLFAVWLCRSWAAAILRIIG